MTDAETRPGTHASLKHKWVRTDWFTSPSMLWFSGRKSPTPAIAEHMITSRALSESFAQSHESTTCASTAYQEDLETDEDTDSDDYGRWPVLSHIGRLWR